MPGIIDIPPATVFHVPQLPSEDDAAAYITSLFAQGGDHTTVLLEQGASYNLYSKIILNGHHQELATEGYPDHNTRKARLFTRGKDEAGAIRGLNKRYQAVRNVYITRLPESRPSSMLILLPGSAIHGCCTDYGHLKGGAALVSIGDWDAVEPAVENCVLADPRGWSCCQLVDGAQGGRAINNLVGPAGQPPPHGPWADGLSIACRNGVIANNTIIDATDGAIVLFGAPGTVVTNNTIIARTRNLLGGINQVDPALFKGNYTGTRVYNNRISTEGAFIHLAMGIGSTTWSDAHDMQVYGGSTLGNVIGPGRFGYGIAAAGCRDYTVLGNRLAPNTVFTGSMDVIPRVSPPTPFLRIDDGWAEGTFQSGFVTGPVRYLIGVQDGLGRSMQFHSGALDWKKGNTIHLRDVCFELATEGRLVVWDQHVHGRVLWSSPLPQDRPSPSSSFEVTLDRKSGNLRIVTSGEEQKVLWDAMTFTDSAHYETRNKDPILVLQDFPPYLQVKDAGAILYATHSQWQHFELQADEFIAVSSSHGSSSNQRAPPPIPQETRPGNLRDRLASLHLPSAHPTPPNHSPLSRCTFLWLDPSSSQLVLHTSQHPRKPEEGDVVWRSPNWKKPASTADNRSKATLQGDGNFVIYAGKEGAVWATGTNGPEKKVDTVAIVPEGAEGGHARLELRSADRVVWHSS